MKMNSIWRAVALAVFCVNLSVSAQHDVTVDFSNLTWNDGGTLSGSFTVSYDNTDTPATVVSADITTTTGSWASGFTYLYNAGSPDTVSGTPSVYQTQINGFPANAFYMGGTDGNSTPHNISLDWQGDTTAAATLYWGDPGSGFFTSESDSDSDSAQHRYIVPEPSSLALAGLGGLLMARFRRGKS